jgi:hypothetical protein
MAALALALVLTAAPPAPDGGKPPPPPLPSVVATHEYDLASPTGIVKLTWPTVTYDRARDEAFVSGEGFVRIFNAAGMEIHRFGDDGSLGQVARAVVLEDGTIIALTIVNGRHAFLRCDFRGELVARFGITGLPEGFDNFEPDELVYRDGKLYFAERARMRVVVTDVEGAYQQSYRIRDIVAAAIPADSEQRPPGSMDGFNVDSRGNLLITMSTMFAGGVVSPTGVLRLFGGRGSTPGRFNNIGGIDADENGNVYVTDRLRAVVSVWSPDLRHMGDFGYRGWDRTGMLSPYDIAVGNGRVYVAQAGNRGVKVYRVKLVEPPGKPAPAAAVAAPAPPRERRKYVPPPREDD